MQTVSLRRRDIIVPVFVREGTGVRQEVSSMPGVFQMSADVAVPWLSARAKEGFGAYLIFGVAWWLVLNGLGLSLLAKREVSQPPISSEPSRPISAITAPVLSR